MRIFVPVQSPWAYHIANIPGPQSSFHWYVCGGGWGRRGRIMCCSYLPSRKPVLERWLTDNLQVTHQTTCPQSYSVTGLGMVRVLQLYHYCSMWRRLKVTFLRLPIGLPETSQNYTAASDSSHPILPFFFPFTGVTPALLFGSSSRLLSLPSSYP